MCVPCGRCMACRLNYASMWAQRLMHEKQYHSKCVFATLTYNDENLPAGRSLVKRDCQLFLKRLRKKFSTRLRFYLCGEYGEQGSRPHYHAILFGVGKDDREGIENAWGKGWVDLGHVEQESCNYVAKYVTKKLNGDREVDYGDRIPEFSLMSRRPGIGGAYVSEFKEEIFNRGFMLVKGRKAAVPKYYQSKVYDTDERKARRKFALDQLQKENHDLMVDKRKELGYAFYREESLRREGAGNILKGRMALKRGKL